MEEEIRSLFRKMASEHGPAPTMLGIVESVNEVELTCKVVDDDNAEIFWEEVQLRPVIDGKESVSLIPKIGTWALVVRIESEDKWMAIAFGEVDKVKIITADSLLEINEGFLIKRGSETLKDVISDLITEIKKITVNTNSGPSSIPINQAAFTAIENRANQLLKS